ncbi:MFS transporter [Lignipirellula cremea]|uniref:Multidrug resistance protein MdtH n=1 Tax=Lignipirellula cremea TaxID=2528010 RepID=A0A518E1B7_9BACT|nr:MFS transporter [Lignipirellula cremea]QDU97885.1 multidrug resistance protein MdtH [Lignipirellula cremea]
MQHAPGGSFPSVPSAPAITSKPQSKPPASLPADPPLTTLESEIREHESRNLLALAAHQVILRVGWIFKVESVIIPTFVDAIAGPAWVRGWLPFLNRTGQTAAPFIYSHMLSSARLKSRSLIVSSMLLSAPFFLLAGTWAALGESRPFWLVPFFLVLYLVFFAAVGVNQMSFGAVQGKLIRPQRRGRLMSISGLVGSVAAITAAAIWLRPWLELPDHGFLYIFTTAASVFLAAGLMACFVYEPFGAVQEPRLWRPFRDAWDVVAHDASFRKMAIVAMMFSMAHLAFPHYQALAKGELGRSSYDLFVWIVAQNIGAGLFSALSGMLADRLGNRFALRVLGFMAAGIPLLALGLSQLPPEEGREYYWLVFLLLGLAPVIFRTQSNYVLELAPQEEHPRYLSTLNVCQSAPFLLSVPLGMAIDGFGYRVVFSLIALSGLTAGLLTFWMDEPRHHSVVVEELPPDAP